MEVVGKVIEGVAKRVEHVGRAIYEFLAGVGVCRCTDKCAPPGWVSDRQMPRKTTSECTSEAEPLERLQRHGEHNAMRKLGKERHTCTVKRGRNLDERGEAEIKG